MLKKIILDNQERISKTQVIKRENPFDKEILKLNKIISFVWPRRAWKTYYMFQVVQDLIKSGEVKLEQVVFLDFTEILDKKIDFNKILESFYQLYPDLEPFFVFDEIQDIENFKEGIISLFNKGFKLMLSGSNSKLLSKELSTEFRGRNFEIFVLPLSFREFLRFKDFELKKNLSTKEDAQLKSLFHEYLEYWAYPEIALIENLQLKEWIIKDYFNVLVYRDLKERYKIDNDYALKYLVSSIISGVWEEFSVNKIFLELKNDWVKVSKDTLYNYLDYLESIFFSRRFYNFFSKQGTSKVYLFDNSFMNVFNKNDSLEKRFENAVFLELFRKYGNETYFKSILSKKVDFYILGKETDIQACFDNSGNSAKKIKDLNKSREKNRLLITFEKIKEDWVKVLDFKDFFL